MSILGNTLFEAQTRVVLFFGRLDNSDLVLAVLLMLATLLLLKKISSGGERFYNRLRMVGTNFSHLLLDHVRLTLWQGSPQ